MARGKGKYGPKSKILEVLKTIHQKFLENALSKLIFSKVENGTPYYPGVVLGLNFHRGLGTFLPML